jgi:hypothetical protein
MIKVVPEKTTVMGIGMAVNQTGKEGTKPVVPQPTVYNSHLLPCWSDHAT